MDVRGVRVRTDDALAGVDVVLGEGDAGVVLPLREERRVEDVATPGAVHCALRHVAPRLDGTAGTTGGIVTPNA